MTGWAPAPNGRIATDIHLTTVTHIDLVDAVVTGNAAALGSVLGHLALPLLTLTVISSAVIVRGRGGPSRRKDCHSMRNPPERWAWMRAFRCEMSGSTPEADCVTASAGTDAAVSPGS